MANFPALKMTAAGKVVQAKAQTGQLLKFTRVALGDGNFVGAPDALVALVSEKQSLSIRDQVTPGDGTSILNVIATNKGVVAGFYMREIATFAEDPDTGEEILYSYSNAGAECDFLPGEGGSITWEGLFDLITVVGNAENVTAVIDDYITIALKSEVDALKPYLLPEGGTVGQYLVKESNAEGDGAWKSVDIDGLDLRLTSIEEPRVAVANQRTFSLQKTITNGLAVYVGSVDASGAPSNAMSRLSRAQWTALSATQLQLNDPLAAKTPVLFVNNEETGPSESIAIGIEGPTLVYPGSTNTFTIGAFDSFSPYTQESTAGTLTRSGKTLTLVIPANAPAGTLDIKVARNGVEATRRVAVGAAAIAAPEILAPAQGAVDVTFQPQLETSSFVVYPAGFDTHAQTRWQIATDAAFTALVMDVQGPGNLTAISLAAAGIRLDPSKRYYLRARHVGAALSSAWSATVAFNTASIYIRKPSIVSPIDGAGGVSPSLTIQADAFSVYGGADTHAASRWQLSTVADFSTLLSDSGWLTTPLTTFKPSGLNQTTTYYARVKYKGLSIGESEWSVGVSFTTANKLLGMYTPLNAGASARFSATLTEIGGYLYLYGGGFNAGAGGATNELWRYDVVKNEWKQLASGGVARHSHVACAINGKLYIASGYNGTSVVNSCYVYDPATNTWAALASNNGSLTYSAAAAINGKMYVWGGYANGSQFAWLYCYDPLTNAWTKLADAPAVTQGAAMVAIGGKLYVVGKGGNWSYDPGTNQWATIASGPTPRFYGVSVVVGGMMYLFGGVTSTASVNDLWCYDPATNTWSQLPAGATPRHYHAGATYGGVFYIYGPSNDLWGIQ
ncbi:kelch repeat-containing protein (plasmid) [Pseudomonas sp. B26140]|uniref:Kelch repeat-containing protein n=1 Tax=Pseudomonas sp. B26140 TaxID=3235112 RepID=UPI003784C3F1